MNKAAEKIIREGVASGSTMEAIRNELISNGLGTEGFDETYKTVVAELGTEERHEAVHEGSMYAGVELDPNRPRDMGGVIKRKEAAKRMMSKRKLIGTIFGFVFLGAVSFAALSSTDELRSFLGGVFESEAVEEADLFDAKRIIEADRYQIAAEAYKSKIFTYEGLCRSIGLDREQFSCFENVEVYAIETRLETGKYYCVDSTGFAGQVDDTRGGKHNCRE